jgi:predicted nucleotidyltransferase
MKLHHLLDEIFGSKSKVRILRLLFRYPEREFTEREIARQIGMSQNTVNKALGDLMKTNAMSYRKIGRANAYIVNKNSVLFPFLKSIFENEKKVREDLIQMLKRDTAPFLSCTLFGSFAKEEEEYGSDLDLLVIVKDKDVASTQLERLESELLKYFNIPLSIILLTPKELIKKWNAPFMKEARRNGMNIGGKSLEKVYGKRD